MDEGDLGHPLGHPLAITPFAVSDLGASAPMSVALHVPQAPEHVDDELGVHSLPAVHVPVVNQDAVNDMEHTLDPVPKAPEHLGVEPQAPEHVPVKGVLASTDTQAALPRVAGSTNLEILPSPLHPLPFPLTWLSPLI